jgi:hypothetical protein
MNKLISKKEKLLSELHKNRENYNKNIGFMEVDN